jgi:hypothetical protein
MKKERIKRPKPSRTEPVRSWASMLAGAADNGARNGRPAASLGDVVSRSVDLGYRVVDEYVRQGQKAARRVGDRSWEPEAMAREAQDVMARMMQYGSDFLSVWMEFMEVAARNPVGLGALAPSVAGQAPASAAKAERNGHEAATAPAASERTRVRIEVASARPAEVSLDLRPDAARLRLVVHALRAVDPDKPRLKNVVLASNGDGEPLALRIRVPDDQPSGTYNGMIIDEETSRPVGTVSVRIGS